MLDLAALGVLLQKPLHGYRLKQQLERFMSGCISVNYGAIYPLLKRLEERGAISVITEENPDKERERKIYSITELGKELWLQEMLAHPHESWVNARSRFAIKFFFFTHLDRVNRIKLIEHRLMVCRLRLEREQREPLPADLYQAAVWQRYLESLQNEIEWLSAQLTEASSVAETSGCR